MSMLTIRGERPEDAAAARLDSPFAGPAFQALALCDDVTLAGLLNYARVFFEFEA